MKAILVVSVGILALIALVSSENCAAVQCLSRDSLICGENEEIAEPDPENGICCHSCVSKNGDSNSGDNTEDSGDSHSDDSQTEHDEASTNSEHEELNCTPDCRLAFVRCQDPETMVCPEGETVQPISVKDCKCCPYCG